MKESSTVFQAFEEAVRHYATRPFLQIPHQATAGYHDGPVDYSYGRAMEEVLKLRDRYRAGGYGTGHRVALLLENRAEMFLHFLALNAVGTGIVPVGAGRTINEMAWLLAHSDSSLIISLPEHLQTAAAAVAAGAGNIPVVSSTGIDRVPEVGASAESKTADETTEAALLYTSGTTGKPKGCMLSNEYFLCMGRWYRDLGGYCTLKAGGERLLTPLPLVHMNALACSSMGMIMTGGCLIQLDRFHPSTWWDTVRESRATCLHYLGVMPAILLSLPTSSQDDFSSRIKFGFGAGVDPRHQQNFERRFGFPLIEGWAMTETGTEVCIAANREPRHVGQRCIGRPTGAIEYRLIDEEGSDVPAGTPGELLVRARGENPRRGFFSGYYKDMQATAAAWEGGFFHTGDVMRVDGDGTFFFVDRRKNIIRRSGENIAAVEVESTLYRHPAVAACAVAPVPDEMRGEEVAACIVPAAGAAATAVTAAELFDFCREQLAYYKVPGWYLFLPELPMTASQKIQRGELKKLASAMVERGECFDLRVRKRRA
jgi:acyl-CoA synthetase (AMP-forming)/AMP-acid ligase II